MRKGSKPAFPTFVDLRPKDIDFDFHMHTTQTDGQNSAQEMIERATELGLSAIAFSEHVNRASDWFPEFVAEIDALRPAASIAVHVGIEVKPLDSMGTMDAATEVLDAAEMVVGSVHRYPDGQGGLMPLAEVSLLGREKAEQTELELALGMLAAYPRRVDVLGHPMGVFSKFFPEFPARAMEALMVSCREHGVAFEISTKYCGDLRQLVELLRKTNPTVSIGSDAHAAQDIGRSFPALREEIARNL